MKIALIGYGKMGKAIEEIAIQRGHEISLKIDTDNIAELNPQITGKADVAIEFTGPHSAAENVRKALEAGIPLVCGSTGWIESLPQMILLCEKKNAAFLYASNFSVGVNLFFELNKKLASLMSSREDYKILLTEIHHTQKKDAPSGTALSLAEQILENIPRKTKIVNHSSDRSEDLEIISERIDPAPGTHKVQYSSEIDSIEIIHTAHTRKGFALGAVIAAEYIKDKKGYFQMKDVLGLP